MGHQLIPRQSSGFSLIELLVATAVMAVLATGAVLSVGRTGPSAAGASDMAHFRDRYTVMQALAIEGRATRGLVMARDGLQTAQQGQTGWDIQPVNRRWRGRIAFAPQGAPPAPGQPDILFLVNGRTTAFSVTFSDGARCETDGWTGLTCRAG